MGQVHHYDTTFEQTDESGTITVSVELRIYFTVTWGREATRDDTGYGDTAEFFRVFEVRSAGQFREIKPSRSPDMESMADSTLYWWAESFVDDHQAELIADAAGILAGEREAAADYRGERS